MDWWEIAKAAGIPVLLLGLIATTWSQTKAVKKGVQALLRDRLIQGYKYYGEQGYADVYHPHPGYYQKCLRRS